MSESSRRMTDQEYDDWLRSFEEDAASAEDVEPFLGRKRIECVISNHMVYGASNPGEFILQALDHYGFDLSAPIESHPITDQDALRYSGYLKEDDPNDAETRAAEYAELLRYGNFTRRGQAEISGKISRGDLHELLTSRGMLGADPVPRADDVFANEHQFAKWLQNEDSGYRRSSWED